MKKNKKSFGQSLLTAANEAISWYKNTCYNFTLKQDKKGKDVDSDEKE